MAVDDLERGGESFAGFAIQVLDPGAKPFDRLDKVVALGGQCGVLRLDLAQFLFGAQIDGAEPLALAPQTFQVLLHRGGVGQYAAVRQIGKLCGALGFDLKHFHDLMRDLGKPRLCSFKTFLGSGGILACRAHGLEGGPRRSVGLRLRGLAGAEPITRGAAFALRRLDFTDQALATLRELRRRTVKLLALAPRLRVARLDRGDLRGRAFQALVPRNTLGGDRHDAPLHVIKFSRERLRLRTDFREYGTPVGRLRTGVSQLLLQRRGCRQTIERGTRLLHQSGRLVATLLQARHGLRNRRKARRDASDLAFG
jgi:hypothetical protein